MRLPDTEIREAIINKLKTKIVYPIRDMYARPKDEPPYVLLSTQTGNQIPVKDCNYMETTILIQVIGSQNLMVNRYEVEEITQDIMEELLPVSVVNYIGLVNFDIISIIMDNITDDAITDDEGVTARKLLRLRIRLAEK